ncbi:MAG: PAS domain S-box protein [Bacteroidetes bacterium]|nr:PAS domain S-box protein [Bacteroidota bacterium]
MQAQASEQMRIFYEIAMAIGNSLDPVEMFRESMLSYLRKLNCTAGTIFYLKKNPDNSYTAINQFSIPYTFELNSIFPEIKKFVPDNICQDEYDQLQKSFPIVQNYHYKQTLYLMQLPDFGILALVKYGNQLNSDVLKTLEAINIKLAKASIACLQKQELEDSELRYKNLTEMLPEMICETDIQGNLTYANQYALEKMGYTNEEMNQGLNIFDLFTEEDRPVAISNFRTKLTFRNHVPTEYEVRKKMETPSRRLFIPPQFLKKMWQSVSGG